LIGKYRKTTGKNPL